MDSKKLTHHHNEQVGVSDMYLEGTCFKSQLGYSYRGFHGFI